MSGRPEDPVEFAREMVARLAARDDDGFVELVDPEVEFVPLLAGVEGGVYVGHAGVRRWLADIYEAWAGYRPSVVQVEAVDTNVIVVELAIELRGRGSDVEIETHTFAVAVRHPDTGRVTWWRFFADKTEACAAASEAAAER